MTLQAIMVLIALAVAGLIVYVEIQRKTRHISIPAAPARPYFVTCFGSFFGQAKDMLGSVNMSWECFWGDNGRKLDDAISDIKLLNQPACIDVSMWLWQGEKGGRTLYPEANLRALFDALRAGGALNLVKWITPCDEPNLPGNEDMAALIPQAMAQIKTVAADYPELAGYRGMVTQTCIRDYMKFEGVSDYSFDHYSAAQDVFAPGGDYDRLDSLLKDDPDARIWPCVGVYKDPGFDLPQMPADWVNAANARPRIGGLVLFLYTPPPQQQPEMVGMKDMPEILAAWKAAGRQIVGVKAA